MRRRGLFSLVCLATLATCGLGTAAPTTAPTTTPAASPKVGDTPPPFTLNALDGRSVALSEANKDRPVVLVVLRGWPGYQCPICTKQVNDLVRRADDFAAEHACVILVYPGPAELLKDHAAEFAQDKSLPAGFTLVMDPDYAMTDAYRLRWDAAGETAYPSSFLIDKTGIIRFAKISNSHGGRATPGQLLDALRASR